ncbi:MAG: hypothetical protein LUO98_06560 [Methanoregula sp.]|nr:hypothetical protein [Methanoregula sp.]
MKVSWKWITGIVCVLLLCTAAGCTNFAATKSSNSNPSQGSSGGSGGGSGGSGGGSGGSSSGSYPQNSYFTFNCKGEWKSSTALPWKDHHGKFTVTGNVPFPIPYDYNNPARYALYTATDTAGSGLSTPLQVQGESYYCSGTPDDCKPCHFIFDGDIFAGGVMVFNGSADTSRKWTVVFTRMPGGENGIWHTRSIQQTGNGCNVKDVEAVGPLEVILPTYACFTKDAGRESGTPFSFSDGSGFVVSPHVDPGDFTLTSLDPRVVFHLGRAPS